MEVGVVGSGSGDSVSIAGGVGTNKLHAMSARSIGIAINRFIVLSFITQTNDSPAE
jgi:3-keto-L-gulonate-6-phosphate decarboxylase